MSNNKQAEGLEKEMRAQMVIELQKDFVLILMVLMVMVIKTLTHISFIDAALFVLGVTALSKYSAGYLFLAWKRIFAKA